MAATDRRYSRVGHRLSSHGDLNLTNVVDGEVLTYQAATDSWINAAASGGNAGLPWDTLGYEYDISTGAGNPGAGILRTNNNSFASVSRIYVSDTDTDGVDTADEIFPSIPVGAVVVVRDPNDVTAWGRYIVTNALDFAGYFQFFVDHVESGSTTNFADATEIEFVVTRVVPLPAGNNTGDPLRWDGSAWVAPTSSQIFFNFNTPPTGGSIEVNNTASTTAERAILKGIYGVAGQGALWAMDSAGIEGFHLYGNMSTSPETADWGTHDLNGTKTRIFYIDTDANFTFDANGGLYITEKAAADADITGRGQLWVDSSDDSLNYVTEAGVNFVLNGGTISDGTTVNSIPHWNGSSWVEQTNLRVTSAGVLTLTTDDITPLSIQGDINASYSVLVDNANNGTVNSARIQISSGDADFAMFTSGSGRTGSIVTGGPTGAQGTLRMLGAHPIVLGTSNTARAIIQSTGEFDILSGNRLRIFDSTNSDVMTIEHNGTDVNVDFVNTLDLNWNDDVAINFGATPGNALKFNTARFFARQFTLADEATETFTVPSHALIVVINNFNSTAMCTALFASTQAPVNLMTGDATQAGGQAAVSLGTGVNPDVDGDANYWKSASTTFNVKNRLGSSRIFTAYIFSAIN